MQPFSTHTGKVIPLDRVNVDTDQMVPKQFLKALTRQGYKATDQTKRAVTSGLTALNELSGDELVKRIEGARRSAVYEMNVAVAKQVLKALRG